MLVHFNDTTNALKFSKAWKTLRRRKTIKPIVVFLLFQQFGLRAERERKKTRKKLATEQINMALAHIHYNTLDKNEQWQLSAFMHFLGREAVLCNLAKKTTACTSAHIQPRRGVKQHQKKIAVLFGGPVYLEYLLLSSKKYQFSISLHNFYSFGFHKNSNKLILLLNGKDIRDSETWGIERRKVSTEEKA